MKIIGFSIDEPNILLCSMLARIGCCVRKRHNNITIGEVIMKNPH
jgi:hypothetical protein